MRLASGLAALMLALSATTVGVTTSGAALAAQTHQAQAHQAQARAQAQAQAQAPPPGQQRPASEVTVSQDLMRDGWDPNEPGLSPATIQGGHFGRLFATHVDGQVYAQPLVVDNPGTATSPPSQDVIVATEKDTVYSLNGATGQVAWTRHLGNAWSSGVNGCKDLTPYIGITSTPVYNPATHIVYVVALISGATTTNPHPAYYVYGLSEQTGFVEFRTPIHGAPVNAPGHPFVPSLERQRTGLLLMNNWLYFGFASYCDYGPYTGYVAGLNITSHKQTLWTSETGSAGDRAGIWMGGGGLMSDGSGRMFLATGNGVSPPPGPGTRPPSELGDAVVRLSQNATSGALTARDFFSPANAPTLDREDGDLGSGGVVGLPFGTSTYPHLLVQAGKDGRVFLLNRDNLGGRMTGPGGTDNVLYVSGRYGGQWGHPAAFGGAGGYDYVYYSGNGEGWSDYLRVLKFNGHTTNHPELIDVANSPGKFGYTSGSPVITSDGNVLASAVLWEVNASGTTGVNARLEAFSAVPAAGHATLTELWSAPIATAAKFSVAATDDGHVYVGARNDGVHTGVGIVYGFGVSNALPLIAGPRSFGAVSVGGTAKTLTVKVTATRTMVVTGVSVTSTASPVPFTLGPPAVNGKAISGFPVALTANQKLTVPVTFAPTVTGAVSGSLDIATNVPGFPTVSIPLSGTGATAGLRAYPAALAFGTTSTIPDTAFNGPVPVGGTQTYPIEITNTGTRAETIRSVTPPAAPFSLAGPAAGTVLQPGQSVSASVTYTPATTTGSDAGSFTITGSAGHPLTVPLSGISTAGSGTLTPSARSVSFGNVPLGTTASASVRLANTGNLPLTVTVFTAPSVPFGTPVPVARDLTVDPGDSISLPVTMTPRSKGAASGAYHLVGTYGAGRVITLTLPVSGNGV